MRELADSSRIGRFMRALGSAADADGACYFAMAECEMPEAMDAPPDVLPALAPFVATRREPARGENEQIEVLGETLEAERSPVRQHRRRSKGPRR